MSVWIQDAVMLLSGGGITAASQLGVAHMRKRSGRGRQEAARAREDATAADRFMRMALELEEKYDRLREKFDGQAEQISDLKGRVSDLTAQLATQDGLLRESLHLIDELLDPSKPTPKMSPALKAAFEGLVGT